MKDHRAEVLADKRRHTNRRKKLRMEKRQRLDEMMGEAKGEARACRSNMENMYEHWITYPEYVKQVEKLWAKVKEHDEMFYDKKTDITWIGKKRDVVLQSAAERIKNRLDPESELYAEFITLPEDEDDE